MKALRGQAARLTGNPFLAEGCLEHVADALVLIEDGRVTAFGPYADIAATIPAGVELVTYENALILPGLRRWAGSRPTSYGPRRAGHPAKERAS